jgi:hypothetical protein
MSFFEMGPRKKLCPQNENHWPAASDAMFDHFKELGEKCKIKIYLSGIVP